MERTLRGGIADLRGQPGPLLGAPAHMVTMKCARRARWRSAALGDESTLGQPFAYSSAERDSNSKPTNRSSPTTHASWPGSMTYASPGPISTSVPSSCLMASRPEWATPTWRAWQVSVPATGLTHSDQRHPGSNVIRAAVDPPIRTTSTRVLSGVLVSSGESKSRDCTPGTAVSSHRSPDDPRALWDDIAS